MAFGKGSGGTRELSRVCAYDRDTILTEINVLLPFGLPGVRGDFRVTTSDRSWDVEFSDHQVDLRALAAQLEDYELEIDERGRAVGGRREGVHKIVDESAMRGDGYRLTLEPDHWGRSFRSIATMKTAGYVGPEEADLEAGSMKDFAYQILQPCCECVNRVIDGLAYCAGITNLPHVSHLDFWAVEVQYFVGSESIGHIKIQGLHMLWWRPPRKLDLGVRKRLESVLAYPNLPLADDLLISAKRRRDQGDYRSSVVDAICAVESILGPLLEEKLRKLGVSKNKMSSFLGPQGIGLSDQVFVALPMIGVEVPESTRNAFAAANAKRNRIVHQGEVATRKEANAHVVTCETLIDILRKE